MDSYYYNELPSSFDDEFLMTFLDIILIVLAVALVVSLIFWIIQSISLHKLAKRRGIRNAWLVWLPVGAEWVLGSVADQYQHLVQGKVTSRRKVLLILGAVSLVLGLVNGAFTLVEEAARLCVEGNACRYSYFKRCLKQLTERSQEKEQQKLPSHENLRGKEFYK